MQNSSVSTKFSPTPIISQGEKKGKTISLFVNCWFDLPGFFLKFSWELILFLYSVRRDCVFPKWGKFLVERIFNANSLVKQNIYNNIQKREVCSLFARSIFWTC